MHLNYNSNVNDATVVCLCVCVCVCLDSFCQAETVHQVWNCYSLSYHYFGNLAQLLTTLVTWAKLINAERS